MKAVGITGGIGSGKSLIARIFGCLGIPLYNADNRARWLSDHDPAIRDAVTDLLGKEAYSATGMNRAWVASQVFDNQGKLEYLNAIIHPVVGADFGKWMKAQQAEYVLKEAALIFESGSFRQLDLVINVSAPVEIRLSRTLKRDEHRKREEVEKIIARQMTDEERRKRSDFDILNDNTTLVIPQVLTIHQAILQDA